MARARAAAETGRTEPAPLARERHDALEAAAIATDADAPVLKQPAPQVLLDFAHHEARQSAGLLRPLTELAPVLLERAVELRLFGLVALVAPRVCCVVPWDGLCHGWAP
jgi:hypothetical protein